MASVSKTTNVKGETSRTIQFKGIDGKRRSIRLGTLPESDVNDIRDKVALLETYAKNERSPDRITAAWLGSIDDAIYDKLAAGGLAEPRPSTKPARRATLAKFLDRYIAGRKDMQPNTLRNLKNSRGRLVNYFGAEQPLTAITPGDADDWRQSMVNDGFATATISKAVKHAKQFFRSASRKGLIASNPFEDVRAGGERNDSRLQFVERATIDSVIAAAPDNQWKLIIALSRYGGLRCPSEHLALTWGDIDWEHNRITLPSPKTERHGKGYRVIPLFPELRPYLEAVRDELLNDPDFDPKATPMSKLPIITRYRDTNANLRTQLLRIMRRAGVEAWERLFHNLRASRQTELADQFPAHVVARWLGNSPAIAERHYLQTIEAHYERASRPDEAVQKAVHTCPVTGTQSDVVKVAPHTITDDYDVLRYLTVMQVPPRGFEPLSPP